jgi:hypothetical protein
MKINHLFKINCHNLNELFNNTNTLSQFKRKLEKQANQDTIRYPYNDYVGDGFEFLIELLIKLHPVDNRIGISDYEPYQEDDNGVDGYGVNMDNVPCAIQIKFRSDTEYQLSATKDHLDSFINESQNRNRGPKVELLYDDEEGCPRHYIFTTGKGLHHYTEGIKFEGYKIKVFGWNDLSSMLDNNFLFWTKIREILKDLEN